MADEIQVKNQEDQNAEVARKVADQDITGKSMAPEETKAAGDALDNLLQEAEKAAAEAAPVVEKPAEGVTPPAKPAETPPAKPADATPVEDPNKKRAEELFKDSPALPANASPKSAEAFSAVKIKAAQEISAREAQLETLKRELADIKKKLENPVPEQVTKELEDLRAFRTRLDIEADPKFQEFDKVISTTREFIYAQLKNSPAITNDIIEQIKKYGGPENVNMEKLFESIKDPSLKRIVDGALTDIEKAKFSKQEAIKFAKQNVDSYVKERQENWKQAATSHTTAAATKLNEIKAKLEYLKEQTVDDKADDATKKSVEARNKFAKETNETLEAALQDDSPEMRAIMLAGMAQLLYLQRVHEATLASVSEKDKVIAERDKTIGELNEKLAKIRASSTSRLREGGAAPGARVDLSKKPDFTKPASEALDELAQKYTEAHAAAR